ncbi:MAG: hypothetical protein AB7G93_05420 [Bdellovibrionales bacterium]
MPDVDMRTPETDAGGGFDQMAQEMRRALSEASQQPSRENVADSLSVLKPLSHIGINILRRCASFARRHPVGVTAAAVIIGYVARRALQERRPLVDAKY